MNRAQRSARAVRKNERGFALILCVGILALMAGVVMSMMSKAILLSEVGRYWHMHALAEEAALSGTFQGMRALEGPTINPVHTGTEYANTVALPGNVWDQYRQIGPLRLASYDKKMHLLPEGDPDTFYTLDYMVRLRNNGGGSPNNWFIISSVGMLRRGNITVINAEYRMRTFRYYTWGNSAMDWYMGLTDTIFPNHQMMYSQCFINYDTPYSDKY